MFSASSRRTQQVLSAVLSLVIASALWYFVVGRDHVETQIEMRIEYRGLPAGLTVLEGSIGHLTARLRGSEELLKSLHPSSMAYTVNLGSVQQGANQIPLNVADIPELRDRGVEIVEVSPSQIVLQIDNVVSRYIPIQARLLPLPKDAPFILSDAILEPSGVTVKGPESRVSPIESLTTAPHDPSKNAVAGKHEAQVAVNAPAQLEITPPVVTLRYALTLKTVTIQRSLSVIVDSDKDDYEISPSEVSVDFIFPAELAGKADEDLRQTRIVVRDVARLSPGESRRLPFSFENLPPRAVPASGSSATILVTRKEKSAGYGFAHWSSPSVQYPFPPSASGTTMQVQPADIDFLQKIQLPFPFAPAQDSHKWNLIPPMNGESGVSNTNTDAPPTSDQPHIISNGDSDIISEQASNH